MKKSFFLSILAVGALVAGCAKSEIVDTKYGNDAIGFEQYIGRDVMSKATPFTSTALPGSVGLYGFYTATAEWTDTTNPNLWANAQVTNTNGNLVFGDGQTKYWTNATDNYSFLAYAPYSDDTMLTATTAAEPTLTYKVPTDLASQIDLIYAQVMNTSKQKCTSTTGEVETTIVPLQFEHALARLTVKASAADVAFKFDVKEVYITGPFIKEGKLTLSEPIANAWSTITSATETYSFYDKNKTEQTVDGKTVVSYDAYDPEDPSDALSTAVEDYAGSSNYLMMIPVDFTGTTDTKLYVKYTTYYEGTESAVNTKDFVVDTKFEAGKAYAISLNFTLDTNNAIQFSVAVTDWVNADEEQSENIKA